MNDVKLLGQIVLEVAATHHMWIGDDGQPLDYLPEREARIAAFINDVEIALAPTVAAMLAAAIESKR